MHASFSFLFLFFFTSPPVYFFFLSFFRSAQSNEQSWWPLPIPISHNVAGYPSALVLSSPGFRSSDAPLSARLGYPCPAYVEISRYASVDRIAELATIQATPTDWLYQALQYVRASLECLVREPHKLRH